MVRLLFDAGGLQRGRQYWKGDGQNDQVGGGGPEFGDAFLRLNAMWGNAGGNMVVGFQRDLDKDGNPLFEEWQHKLNRSLVFGTQTGANPEGPADGLNRLTRYRRGTLNAEKKGLTTTLWEQDWRDTAGNRSLDLLGNWDTVRTNTAGGGTFTTVRRGHNTANEYTSLNGTSAYGHDRNGNLTDDGSQTYRYDFANHLAAVVQQTSGDTIGQYVYDGLGRRVKKVVPSASHTIPA